MEGQATWRAGGKGGSKNEKEEEAVGGGGRIHWTQEVGQGLKEHGHSAWAEVG